MHRRNGDEGGPSSFEKGPKAMCAAKEVLLLGFSAFALQPTIQTRVSYRRCQALFKEVVFFSFRPVLLLAVVEAQTVIDML